MRPRALFAVLVIGFSAGIGALSAGCKGTPEGAATESDDGGAALDASIDAEVGARRPLRRFYMSRTDKRCEVYWVEGDTISAPSFALCPATIEVGERIRLAGKSCFREGTPQREQPVVCPGDLMLAVQQDQEREALRKAEEQAADGGAGDAGDAGSGSSAAQRH